MTQWHFSKPRIPARAVIITIAALAVPFVDTSFNSTQGTPESELLWLLALVPAFLLAYYRGWTGVATALAAGMAVITTAVCIALLRGGALDDTFLLAVVAAYIAIALATGWLSDLLHGKRAQAELIALTDDLTGLANRRRGRMQLENACAEATAGNTLCVILFDLDHFKAYNDKHGHPRGDDMLCIFADVLTTALGGEGTAVRYGGEEFLAILSPCDEAQALAIVERVRDGLREVQKTADPVTVSAGVALWYATCKSADDLIIAADRALYAAKQQGRDRVCVAAAGDAVPT